MSWCLKIVNEKEVTIDDVIREANGIWSYVRKQKFVAGDDTAASKLIESIQVKHPQICRSYPIVIRFMCQMREYTSNAFRQYLRKLKHRPYPKQEEWLEYQADYVGILVKDRNPRATATQIAAYRKQILDALQQEHNAMKENVERCDKEVTARIKALKTQNDTELREFAEVVGVDGMVAAGSVRVESDSFATARVDIALADVPREKSALSAAALLE